MATDNPLTRRVPWFQRRFNFDFPWELYPEHIERLRGTPARTRALVHGISPDLLTRRVGDRWSIQENVAHLSDLEEILFYPRIQQFVDRNETLMAADVTNAVTNNANHNAGNIDAVLDRFDELRLRTISKLESLPHELFARSALHPRLGVPMRLVDHLLFVAEHDDYHMAHITGLKRALGAAV